MKNLSQSGATLTVCLVKNKNATLGTFSYGNSPSLGPQQFLLSHIVVINFRRLQKFSQPNTLVAGGGRWQCRRRWRSRHRNWVNVVRWKERLVKCKLRWVPNIKPKANKRRYERWWKNLLTNCLLFLFIILQRERVCVFFFFF